MTSWLVIIAWDKKSGGTAGVSVQHAAQRQGRPPEDSRQKEAHKRKTAGQVLASPPQVVFGSALSKTVAC